MTISSQILALDRDITLAINSCHSAAFDQFFFLFSRTQVWVFFFIVLTYVLCRTYGWRTMLSVVIAVALAVLVSDQLCNVFKYSVCRLRPTHEPSLSAVIHTVNGYVGGDYGFCSSHAANTVALAILTSLVLRRWFYSLLISSWVLLSCWSRIYLGVHYFGDILFGLILGSVVSLIVYMCWRKTRWRKEPVNLSLKSTIILIASYFITVLLLFVLPFFVA